MESVKISIIVPVYNSEEYLCKCIDSIIGQSFQSIEVLLIDDGSTDNSYSICESYVEKDNRIRVFSTENRGVSSARNIGIKNATGVYALFCDSDDELPQECLASMYQKMQEVQVACMLVGGFISCEIDRATNTIRKTQQYVRHDIYAEGEHYTELLQKIILENNIASVWGKLFCLDIIRKNDLLFNTELIVLEDFEFVLSYLNCVKSVISIEEYVYEYYKYSERLGSNLRRARNDYMRDIEFVYDKMKRYSKGFGEGIEEALWRTLAPNVGAAYEAMWFINEKTIRGKLTKFKEIQMILKKALFQKYVDERKNRLPKIVYYNLRRASFLSVFCLYLVYKFGKCDVVF